MSAITFSLVAAIAFTFATSADNKQVANPCSLIINYTVRYSISNFSISTPVIYV